MPKKDDYIRVRVTTDDKKIFKEVATDLGVSMSELMIVATKNVVRKHKEKLLSQNDIEQRAINTEDKLQEVKMKMMSRRERSKARRKFIRWGKRSEG